MFARKEEPDKVLLIGCGSKPSIGGCGYSHPPAHFITVDILPSIKPDVVADISDVDGLKKALDDKKFPAILFEFLPKDAIQNLKGLSPLLTKEGYLIYLGSGFENLKYLPNGQSVWIGRSNDWNEVIIIQNEEAKTMQLAFNPVLKKYLTSHLKDQPEKLLHLTRMTPEYKTLIANIEKIEDLTGKIPYHIKHTLLEKFLSEGITKAPPDSKQIQAIISSYQPGKIRRFFSGKTKGMQQLENFIREKGDDLNPENLLSLFELIKRREERIYNTNITRDKYGETTRIFHTLGALILSYFTNNIEIFSLSPRPSNRM